MLSQVENINGLPTLVVNGEAVPEMAYITYKTDNNCYSDFAAAGVKLYSVNLNFSEMPINENAPVLVFQKGIFEREKPDFSIVDRNFDEIISACPDAYIFPRVNVNLSCNWEKSHPDELCETGVNARKRASFASDLWAEEVKKCLTQLIEYIENSQYAERVIGYQIAGGNTDEWFPFDRLAFYGKRAKEKFIKFCKEKSLPKNEESYYTFASELVAERIIEFATQAKRAVENKKIVGAFYGYTIGCPSRSECHLALDKILESDKVDFLCSPLTYVHGRAPGLDPYPMVPIDSIKLHNKLYFSENDIRTNLSRPVSPHPNYSVPIWVGPKKSISLEQIKLNFCRAFIRGHGMWWFDMWGGWYKDSDFMKVIAQMAKICSNGMDKPLAEVALFMDEKCYLKIASHKNTVRNTCNMLGLTGAMYDVFLASDFDMVYNKYKACIFIEPTKTGLLTECIEKAIESRKGVKVITEDDYAIAAEDFKNFFAQHGITMPTEQKAVIYIGEKYASFYAHENGRYDFVLDGKRIFTDLFTGEKIAFPTDIKKTSCWLFKR